MKTKATSKRVTCPSCDTKAKRVSAVTMRALLRDEFASQFVSDDQSCCESSGGGCTSITDDTGWRYCNSKDCDVVYFSEREDTSFTKAQLKIVVGVKETSGERPLCYCFGHSVASIQHELQSTGSSVALEDIRAKMKTPGCQCETMNPSGSCCLGNVAMGIQIAQRELETGDTETTVNTGKRTSSNRGEKIAKVGTIVSAIIASSCCWLPLLLLAVGVSGAGIASMLEAYRPLFMVVTFGFLGAAFYYTYRPKVAGTNDRNCCDSQEARCDPVSGRRFSMMAFNKIMVWVVTVLAVAFLFFPNYIGAFLGGDGETVTTNMNRAVIRIEGMTCEGCAVGVANAIRKIPSVQAVEVDYERSEAVVGTEVCCPVPEAAILTALEMAGYSGKFESEASSETEDSTSSNQNAPILIDLSSDGVEFRSPFNDSKGAIRVVMLVSPG
jgi:copper chaperone CopZ